LYVHPWAALLLFAEMDDDKAVKNWKAAECAPCVFTQRIRFLE